MDRSFEGLRVWQQSRAFVNSIYDIMEEVRSMLYLCLDRKMINQETFDKLKSEATSISNQIYRLIESISRGQRESDKGQRKTKP